MAKKQKTKKVKLTNSQKKIIAKRQLKMRNRLILRQFGRLRTVFKQLRGEIDPDEQLFISELAWQTFSTQLYSQLKKGMRETVNETAKFVSEQRKISGELIPAIKNDALKKLGKEVIAEKVTNITEKTKETINKIIVNGQTSGTNIKEIAKEITEKVKGMEKTIGEIARTPMGNENRELLIKEKEAEIKNKTAKIDDYKLLLIFYSPVNNPDNYNFERIAKEFIKNFPDYPEAYFIMADFLFHTSQDYQEILNYTQKGIEAYKNVDINKYPEFTYENSRNHPMNELFTIMIDVYLKKGEKEKALDVFNKNKKIIKYWMPPANYAQLVKKLGVQW